MTEARRPTTGWYVGQRAVIDRSSVVTIERVTPSGRAVVQDRTFEVDGIERSKVDYHRRSKLEPLTPEIEAEMALVNRGRRVARDARHVVDIADNWLRSAFFVWGKGVPDVADVEKAERLIEAIRQAMELEVKQ